MNIIRKTGHWDSSSLFGKPYQKSALKILFSFDKLSILIYAYRDSTIT